MSIKELVEKIGALVKKFGESFTPPIIVPAPVRAKYR